MKGLFSALLVGVAAASDLKSLVQDDKVKRFQVPQLEDKVAAVASDKSLVVGVGLSKTGTTSLTRYLQQLGLDSLHNDGSLAPFMPHPNQDFAFEGRYEDVDAVTDLPTAFYYKEILQAYPNAKFVLTTRNTTEWWNSVSKYHGLYEEFFCDHVPMRAAEVWKLAYGSYTPDEAMWTARYEQHNKAVVAAIPAEQLLVLDVTATGAKSAMEQICEFVDQDCTVPATVDEKPHYSTADFAKRVAARKASGACSSCDAKLQEGSGRRAYVTMLGAVEEEIRRVFTASVLAWASSLQATGTDADIVCMVHEKYATDEEVLMLSEVMNVVLINSVGPAPKGVEDSDFLDINRAKIHVWNLGYEVVQFMDADIVVTGNMDYLFDLAEESPFVVEPSTEAPINTGWFVTRPSCQAFSDLTDIVATRQWSAQDGWLDYGPFTTEKGDSRWNFYQSHSDQGILFYYWVLVKDGQVMSELDLGESVFHHFVGGEKPWMKPSAKFSSLWNKHFNKMESKMNGKHFKTLSMTVRAFTEAAEEQESQERTTVLSNHAEAFFAKHPEERSKRMLGSLCFSLSTGDICQPAGGARRRLLFGATEPVDPAASEEAEDCECL